MAWIKSAIALCPAVIQFTIIREESQIDKGLWGYRLTLKDESLLEMFEFFIIESGQVDIIKYRFHWQQKDGTIIKRWDNAAHHPEISTYPHHLHDGAENTVVECHSIAIQEILTVVSQQMLTD